MSKQTLRQLWSPNRPEPSVDHLVTHGTHMGALEIHVGHYKALYKFNFYSTVYFTITCGKNSGCIAHAFVTPVTSMHVWLKS